MSVSYTHLDVYKRQILLLSHGKELLLLVISDTSNTETPKDVYKRQDQRQPELPEAMNALLPHLFQNQHRTIRSKRWI